MSPWVWRSWRCRSSNQWLTRTQWIHSLKYCSFKYSRTSFCVLFFFFCHESSFLNGVMGGVLHSSYTIQLTQRRGVLVASQSLLGNAIAVNSELTKTVADCQGRKNVTVDMETAVFTGFCQWGFLLFIKLILVFLKLLFLVWIKAFFFSIEIVTLAKAKMSS